MQKKYGFKRNSQIRKWINAYNELGVKGLLRSRKNQNYSVQFKLDAIELSYQELANCLKINNPPLIANWLRTYRKFGIGGLSKQKGCPAKMSTKKSKEINSSQCEQTRVDKLEKENRLLKIENAYLKELRRLRLEDKQKMKESHESFTASEDLFN